MKAYQERIFDMERIERMERACHRAMVKHQKQQQNMNSLFQTSQGPSDGSIFDDLPSSPQQDLDGSAFDDLLELIKGCVF